MQLWCHILATVLLISRAQLPHRKEIFPAVLTTQFLSILLAETKPTLPITDETSMDHSWAYTMSQYLCPFELLQQKYHRQSDLNNKHSHSSGGWEVQDLGNVRFLCLVRVHFLHRQLSSSCILTWQKGWEISLGYFFLIRALIPFIRAPPLWPNHLPKDLLPNTITVGVKISTSEFGGWHKHSVYSSQALYLSLYKYNLT